MTKRLAYLDIAPEALASLLSLPDDAEVVGVAWDVDPPVVLVQVRSEEVPERVVEAQDADADHRAEHVVAEYDASGFIGFRPRR